MTISWPPYGRWAAGYGADEKALSWVPKSTVAGKVGYALPPGGHPELAAGFCLSVASTSKQKEAAYLFIQWLNSDEISIQRVQLPYALRDPFRGLALQRSRVSAALAGGEGVPRDPEGGLGDGPARPLGASDRPVRGSAEAGDLEAVGRRRSEGESSTKPPKQWDQTTERIGVDRQKAVYKAWAAKSGAYPAKS